MVTTKTEVGEAIADLVERLQVGLTVEAVVLYGSHANGTPGEYSDIDVAVVSPDFEGMSLPRRQELISELTVHRKRLLSPIGYPSSEYHNPGPHSFLREIVRTGRVVYPKS